MSRLSVVIITKNEEARVRDCLESVRWAEEIIVVDACSEDRTIEICREYTEKVHRKAWQGYATQKNWGIAQASGNWVLSLDADERVSAELREEILNLLHDSPDVDGFYIPRKNYLGRRWMRYAGQYPDYQLRLFCRGRGRFVGRVHEKVELDGSTGYLRHPIDHYTYCDLRDYLRKIEQYAGLEAQERWERGERASWRDALKPIVLFFCLYLGKGGWREGWLGLINSIFLAFYLFLRAAWLWELQTGEGEE
jgi:glycosyltransferase involved in cell wall biosynthesis